MDLSERVIEHRRWFHRHPELGFEEFETSGYIKKNLEELGIQYRTVGTGIIADLDVRANQTIALRADIDALPIQEISEKAYISENVGKMHACGHDAHAAMLLTAAEYMVKEKKPSKNVRFVFQPAEEGGCGACEMVKAGAMDGVDMVFGMHVWIGTESGKFSTKVGPLMAGVDELTIDLKGTGGHAASPNQTVNPLAIGATLINELYKIRPLRVDPLSSAVINVTSFNGGNTYNVVPTNAELLGTIRTFSTSTRDEIIERINDLKKMVQSLGGNVTMKFKKVAPPVVNSKIGVDESIKVIKRLGFDFEEALQTMGSEDFAYYLEKVPGAFLFLGIH
jgi:amidohydrolase